MSIDLKKGELIAVVALREVEEQQPASFDEIMMGMRRQGPVAFDGKPWKVITVSMPWVLVTDGTRRASFDTRRVEFVYVSKEYARNWRDKEKSDRTIGEILTGDIRKKKKKKRHPSECPRCDVKMKQMLKQDKSGWQWVCGNCGFLGPDVPGVEK